MNAAVAGVVHDLDVVHEVEAGGDFFGGNSALVGVGLLGGDHVEGFVVQGLVDGAVAEVDPFDACGGGGGNCDREGLIGSGFGDWRVLHVRPV